MGVQTGQHWLCVLQPDTAATRVGDHHPQGAGAEPRLRGNGAGQIGVRARTGVRGTVARTLARGTAAAQF